MITYLSRIITHIKKLKILRNTFSTLPETFQNRHIAPRSQCMPERAEMDKEKKISWTLALAAGGAAGTAVDVALFPLDTIKTRLQSDAGFLR